MFCNLIELIVKGIFTFYKLIFLFILVIVIFTLFDKYLHISPKMIVGSIWFLFLINGTIQATKMIKEKEKKLEGYLILFLVLCSLILILSPINLVEYVIMNFF